MKIGTGFLILSLCFAATEVAHGHAAWPEEPILPLNPPPAIEDYNKVELGRSLFSDPILSKTRAVSCETCHSLDHGGVDGLRVSIGVNGAVGSINSPSVFNSSLNFVQFWNGRAKNLEEQIDGPIQHEKEMGSSWAEIVNKLQKDAKYPAVFARSYRDGVTVHNVKNAIVAFEGQLITPNARFDRYLRGDKNILTERELEGYRKFKNYGCIACHQGRNIGGNMFQNMGIMGNYFKDRGTAETEEDQGRYTVTKKESDRHVFRVPSLRNVNNTGPYFHDGSAKKLSDAVDVMSKYQLGRKLSLEDNQLIVDFLNTLTGDRPAILGYRGSAP